MAIKFGIGDDVGDIYFCAKFHYDPMRGFAPRFRPAPARTGAYKVTALVFWVQATPYREATCTDFHDLYVKWRSFLHKNVPFGVPKTKFHISTLFSPETQIFGNFNRTKFRVKKALTMRMLTCKLPLIVIIAI